MRALECRLQELPELQVLRLQVRPLQVKGCVSKFVERRGCVGCLADGELEAADIAAGFGDVSRHGPNPWDRSITKRTWEKMVQQFKRDVFRQAEVHRMTRADLDACRP